MKFLHAADLHLDTPFRGLSDVPTALQRRLIEAPIKALHRLTDLALDQRVDFVLLVGDLFDASAQSVQAQAALMSDLTRLARAQIPVVLSFGNHDFQPDLSSWHFPRTVHVLGNAVTTVTLTTAAQERVAISGFSYGQRWVERDMVTDYPLKTSAVDYQIGCLHGQVGRSGDHYAPFNVGELQAKHYDYWALGHIHQRQALSQTPPIMYPGNIQGRHRDEQGAKGCLIVTSTADHRLQPEFTALTDVTWADWQPTLRGMSDRADLLRQLTDQLNAQFQSGLTLVTVTLPAEVQLAANASLALNQGSLLGQLQANADTTWWPVGLYQMGTAAEPQGFGLNGATWDAAGEAVVTPQTIADLADSLLNEAFLNQALLEDQSAEQWRDQVMRLLTEQYHLTMGGDQDAD